MSGSLQILARRAGIRAFDTLGINHLLAPWFAGRGVVVMLHSVVASREDTAIPGIAIDAAFLDSTLKELRRIGTYFARVDEIPELLHARGERFAVFTLDDGYRDNLGVALPIFRAHAAPMAVYPTIGFIDSASGQKERSTPWREKELQVELVALDHLVRNSTSVRAGKVIVPTQSAPQKERAVHELARLLADRDDSPWDTYAQLLEANGTSLKQALTEAYLSWEELQQLAADDLVQIGAHTVTHRPLAVLSETDATHEIRQGRQILSARLGVPIRSIAYPYGSHDAAGGREYALATAEGFDLGFTTIRANLQPEHSGHLLRLPRLGLSLNSHSQSLAFVRGVARGGQHAVLNRMRRVVI